IVRSPATRPLEVPMPLASPVAPAASYSSAARAAGAGGMPGEARASTARSGAKRLLEGGATRPGPASPTPAGASAGGAAQRHGTKSGVPGLWPLRNVTLRHNRAVGGAGNTAGTLLGSGFGGGLVSHGFLPGTTATVSDSTVADNEAVGGQGSTASDGGDARGG